MGKKVKRKPGAPLDELDEQTALVLAVAGEETDQGTITMMIADLWEHIKEMYTDLKISLSEINRRLERWAEKGWVQINGKRLILNEHGRQYVVQLAMCAAT